MPLLLPPPHLTPAPGSGGDVSLEGDVVAQTEGTQSMSLSYQCFSRSPSPSLPLSKKQKILKTEKKNMISF